MLLQLYVDQHVNLKIDIRRKPSHKPAASTLPDRAVVLQEHTEEPVVKTAKPKASPEDKNHAKPMMVYVAGHAQQPSGGLPAKVTAAAWVDTGSRGLCLMTNVKMKFSAVSQEMAELGAVHTVLTSDSFQDVMKGKAVVHVMSGSQRNVALLNSACVGSPQCDVAVAAYIRSLAAAAPFKVKFFYKAPESDAAELRKAGVLAQRCDSFQQVCDLRPLVRLGMGFGPTSAPGR